jgi:hypothetical protein
LHYIHLVKNLEMTSPILVKSIIIVLLLSILAALGTALFRLLKSRGRSEPTARALSLRVALSMGLFILLMLAFATGLITPNTIY